MTEEELREITERAGEVNYYGQPFSVLAILINMDIPALVGEIRRLNGVIHDMGLPDANDFPHPTGGIL